MENRKWSCDRGFGCALRRSRQAAAGRLPATRQATVPVSPGRQESQHPDQGRSKVVAAFSRKPDSSFPEICGALPRRRYDCGSWAQFDTRTVFSLSPLRRGEGVVSFGARVKGVLPKPHFSKDILNGWGGGKSEKQYL